MAHVSARTPGAQAPEPGYTSQDHGIFGIFVGTPEVIALTEPRF
jgi:hypothetical protein